MVDSTAARMVVAGCQAERNRAVVVRHRLAQGRHVTEDIQEAGETPVAFEAASVEPNSTAVELTTTVVLNPLRSFLGS